MISFVDQFCEQDKPTMPDTTEPATDRADEKAERERIEAERVAKHRGGIETIRGYPAQAQGKTAAQIDAAREALFGIRFNSATFEEFADEAATAMRTTLDALVELSNAAAARELDARRIEAQPIEQARVAAEQKAEADRLAAERAVMESERAAIAAERAAADAARMEIQRRELEADERRAALELAAQNTPAQDSQQVLKAEAPAPDATDRDGTRAVEYLRRSRKAEAEVERLRDALRSLDFAAGCLIGKPITEIETGLVLIARAAKRYEYAQQNSPTGLVRGLDGIDRPDPACGAPKPPGHNPWA